MIIMLISAVLLIISVGFFSFSYSMQGLNKAIIYTPIEMMFEDVKYDGSIPEISSLGVKESLNNYYKKTLPRYCKSYDVEYYFYNLPDDSMCTSEFCDGVEVTINANLNLGYKYHRVMYYELSRGSKNG